MEYSYKYYIIFIHTSSTYARYVWNIRKNIYHNIMYDNMEYLFIQVVRTRTRVRSYDRCCWESLTLSGLFPNPIPIGLLAYRHSLFKVAMSSRHHLLLPRPLVITSYCPRNLAPILPRVKSSRSCPKYHPSFHIIVAIIDIAMYCIAGSL